MPALLTIASSGPTSLRHRATESSLVTSSTCAWMPSDPLNADMSVATTECPRLASTCAVAIPMPRAAPVIKTLGAFDIRRSPVFFGLRLTTQAQRPGPRDATIATTTRWPGSQQRRLGGQCVMLSPVYSQTPTANRCDSRNLKQNQTCVEDI